LYPQHETPPLPDNAQECEKPEATIATPLLNPSIDTGVAPFSFPQHETPPLTDTAHEWYLPKATIATPLLNPATVTGVFLWVAVPSPIWLYSLRPQHETLPLTDTAHEWYPPKATNATPLLNPATVTGVFLWVAVPSPTWP
jgi:hypothetical protein